MTTLISEKEWIRAADLYYVKENLFVSLSDYTTVLQCFHLSCGENEARSDRLLLLFYIHLGGIHALLRTSRVIKMVIQLLYSVTFEKLVFISAPIL